MFRCRRSLTDTSYFPTEDLNDVPEQPTGSEASSGSKDLAFLGYTVRRSINHRMDSGCFELMYTILSHSSAVTKVFLALWASEERAVWTASSEHVYDACLVSESSTLCNARHHSHLVACECKVGPVSLENESAVPALELSLARFRLSVRWSCLSLHALRFLSVSLPLSTDKVAEVHQKRTKDLIGFTAFNRIHWTFFYWCSSLLPLPHTLNGRDRTFVESQLSHRCKAVICTPFTC